MRDPAAAGPSPVQLDEERIARALALGIPILSVAAATTAGIVVGPATGILAFAAGTLLGVIALLWSSLRFLTGDAPLPPELEALDMTAQGGDALVARKTMLLRALKDLESERAIGKIEQEDYEQLAATYRGDLKAVLKRIDDSLEPHRAEAESLARAHLEKAGLLGGAPATTSPRADGRLTCPACAASNEADAKFCKGCAATLPEGATRAPSEGESHVA